MKVPVERPPLCPYCKTVELSYLDDYVVSFMFRCPECKRGFTQQRENPKSWEKVDFVFDYTRAPLPTPPDERPRIAWVVEEDIWE